MNKSEFCHFLLFSTVFMKTAGKFDANMSALMDKLYSKSYRPILFVIYTHLCCVRHGQKVTNQTFSNVILDIIKEDKIRIHLASWNERMHKIRKYEDETKRIKCILY